MHRFYIQCLILRKSQALSPLCWDSYSLNVEAECSQGLAEDSVLLTPWGYCFHFIFWVLSILYLTAQLFTELDLFICNLYNMLLFQARGLFIDFPFTTGRNLGNLYCFLSLFSLPIFFGIYFDNKKMQCYCEMRLSSF